MIKRITYRHSSSLSTAQYENPFFTWGNALMHPLPARGTERGMWDLPGVKPLVYLLNVKGFFS